MASGCSFSIMDANDVSQVDDSTKSKTLQPLSLFKLINDNRIDITNQLRRRVSQLKEILDKKSELNIPVTLRESECLQKYQSFLEKEDIIKSNADKLMDSILNAVEAQDQNFFENLSLVTEDLQESVDEELNLDALISDYASQPYKEFTKDDFRNLRIADIVAAVNVENGNSKANKKNKRKPARPKGPVKPKIKKSSDELRNCPPELMQYVRGLFNVLRIIILKMADPEEGVTTERICDIVSAWSSDPRIRKTNAQWITKCDDWSKFVSPALALLAGRNSKLILASCPTLVRFDASTRSWFWLGYQSSRKTRPEDPVEAAEAETTLLARLFSLWARRNDFGSTGSSAGGRKQNIQSSSHMELEDDVDVGGFSDSDVDGDEEMTVEGDEEQEAPLVASAKSRRRQGKLMPVPPPYYPTDWQCTLSTPEQRRQFQIQEAKRFSMPWAPFSYSQHGYVSVVAPVFRDTNGNRMRAALSAREHPLLQTDRPPWVSISEIVRDAVARLPNGEGTRPDIAMLVQDSGYLVSSFNFKQLSQCISSALDRLQSEGENSPVMYDSSQRLWIYRFRHLSTNEFFRMYKEHSEYQRERFQQIYPRGRVSGAGSNEMRHRRASELQGSRGVMHGSVPRNYEDVNEMEEDEEDEIDTVPDIDDLTREESDESIMEGSGVDDGEGHFYSESEMEHSQDRMAVHRLTQRNQQRLQSWPRNYSQSHSLASKGQHFQYPPDGY